MIYKIETRSYVPSFGMNTGSMPGHPPTSPSPDEYQDLAKDVRDPAAPMGVTLSILDGKPSMDHIGLARKLETRSSKIFNLARIPDFWTVGPLAQVTQKGKDVIETMDPDIHLFIPIELHLNGAERPMDHDRFYHFVCRRFLAIEESDIDHQGLSREQDKHARVRGWAYSLTTLIARPDIQEYAAKFPIWKFRSGRNLIFANETFIKAGKRSKIKGLEVSSKGVERHVTRVA